ncbi:MAG: hypothetical protein JO057_14705 [Chloroflexi bacterium]|nr:hypothetical protein [Chloroflexota bacterium]
MYSFTYSNVGVISVDANDLSYEVQGILGYSQGSQAAWLRQRLGEFRADPTIDFIIVFYHEYAFSTCASHSSDGGVRSTLGPLFAEHQVDLAIAGSQPPVRADQPDPLQRRQQQRVVVGPGRLAVAERSGGRAP